MDERAKTEEFARYIETRRKAESERKKPRGSCWTIVLGHFGLPWECVGNDLGDQEAERWERFKPIRCEGERES